MLVPGSRGGRPVRTRGVELNARSTRWPSGAEHAGTAQTGTSGLAVAPLRFCAAPGPPSHGAGRVLCHEEPAQEAFGSCRHSDCRAPGVRSTLYLTQSVVSLSLVLSVVGRHPLRHPGWDFQPGKPGFHKSQTDRRCWSALLFGGPSRSQVSKNLRHSSSAVGIKTQARPKPDPRPTLPTCVSPRWRVHGQPRRSPGGWPATSLAAEATSLGVTRRCGCHHALRTCHPTGMRCCRQARCFSVGPADASGTPKSAVAACSAPPELSRQLF